MIDVEDALSAPETVEPATEDDRNEVVSTPQEALDIIDDGMTVAIGGFVTSNHPMVMVRELIGAELEELTVIGPATGGLEVDMMLAGAELGGTSIEKLITPYVGAELYLAVGNCFRKAVEEESVELWESSEYILYAGLYAESMSLPFMAWRGGVGTSIPDLNPDLKEFEDPINGETLLAVPAIRPDVAIVHVNRAGPYGNGQHLGATFGDRLMAQAADRVILTTEEVVSNQVIRDNHHLTTIPYADHVVEAPYGSHPFDCHSAYVEDETHIHEYIDVTKRFLMDDDTEALQAYFDQYVFGPETHEDYLDEIGINTLLDLRSQQVEGNR